MQQLVIKGVTFTIYTDGTIGISTNGVDDILEREDLYLVTDLAIRLEERVRDRIESTR